MGKVDALLDVAFEALDSLTQELLLLLGDALQGVGGVLDAVGLHTHSVSQKKASFMNQKKFNICICRKCKLTPSSTGTEKKSTPVALAMAAPPGTPGR